MDVLISSNDFVNIFDNIIENSNDFLHTEIKRTMIDGIFCECEKYYAGINNILHLKFYSKNPFFHTVQC